MISREFNLYLHAGHSIPLVINCNQYDRGEQWLFTLFNADGTQYVPSSGAIVGIKSDNLGIINSGTVDSQGRVVINETQQMTAAVGKAVFELVIDDGTHGTANFVVLVEPKPGDNADLSESDISMIEEAVEAAANIKPYGSPLVASTVAGMTDHDKVYVYVGSETGYTSGHWYYYDGDSWESGGVYNSVAVQTDTTLTLSGVAADAKKTGDEISDLKSQISGGVLTAEIKSALMNCINYVAWKNNDPNASQYISALQNALYPPANLSSISAVFTQGSAVIYDTDSLETLKQYLVVTAHYSDSTSETVTTYTLSGTLTVGTSTVTVSYGGKTTTFTVTVTKQIPPTYYFAVDQSKVVSGYIDDSGQHVDGSNYHYVDEKYAGFAWMPVTSALAKDAKALRYAWYDENQDFISRSYGSNLSYVSDASAYYFIAGWSGTSAFSYILAIGNMNDSLFVNEGYLIQTTDGQLVVDSTSVATDFIAVGDASMYLCASVDGTTLRMAFYDSSKTYISSASTNTSANRTPTAIPSNAAYFRISKPTNGICGYPIIEEL